jgi:cobalt-zinc-cadmium efflux system outer membrane protein
LVGTSEAARAARDAELALERLRYVLGLQLSNIVIKPGRMPEPQVPAWDVEQLVGEAVATRPDLRAVQLAISAAEERADLAHRDIWQLSGWLPDINSRGRTGFEAGPGLRFNIPLFHQNQGAIARAEADAERLHRQFINRRDMAAMEVRQAYILFLQAKKDLEIWRDQILPQASQAVTSSRKALEENTVSLLLVLETTRQLLTAQQREREANAQMRRAIAELERSVGRRLLDGTSDDSANAEILPIPQVELTEDTP